ELSGEVAAFSEALPGAERHDERHAATLWRRSGSRALRKSRPLLSEAGALFALATPLALAGLVSMGLSITDVVMMGWLGPTSRAAGAAASDLYSIFFYLGAGVLQAVSPLVAGARGAGRHSDVTRSVRQGMWAAIAVAVPGAVAVWHADAILAALGVVPEIAAAARPYARMMAITFLPMAGVMLLRQTLAACGRPRAFFWAMVGAVPLNALGNWVLMDGRLGAPRLGLAGIGLSSALVATFLMATLALSIGRDPELRGYRFFAELPRPEWRRLVEIFRIGGPIGAGNLGEMGVFLFSTVILGTLGVEVLAGHAVALRMAGVLYAWPMGLAQAAMVRIALGAGAGDRAAVRQSAGVALASATAVGVVLLVGVLCFRDAITGAFLDRGSSAFGLAAVFLLVLAVMQPVETLATTAAGALRGLCDTRLPMIVLLAGHWGIGFSTGLALAFWVGLGGLGIWIGLATGSTVVAVAMTARLRSRVKGEG
ncbi:MAG TPA: MATE family efflux transporter, partial [Thermoanaerobaculia bacterium]|nr:MATE family efflux transporter [Thermoanaerobaculia bacterium]